MADKPFTDADDARPGPAEFRELPRRPRRDEYVESIETQIKRGRPEAAPSEAQIDALHAGG